MNTGRAGRQVALRRMLLALDAMNCESALINAAMALAEKLEADLDALFVEDSDIYAVAELPFTREVSLSSARERDISGQHVEQALRSRSRDAEQRFSAALARNRLKGRFDVLRAPRGEALMNAAAGVDVLILTPADPALMRMRVSQQPRPGRIFAICGATPASERALDIASRLARQDHGAFEAICRGDPARELLAALDGSDAQVNLHVLPAEATLTEMLRGVDANPASILVIATDLLPDTDRAALPERLAALRCRVLLVN